MAKTYANANVVDGLVVTNNSEQPLKSGEVERRTQEEAAAVVREIRQAAQHALSNDNSKEVAAAFCFATQFLLRR